jgi:hypothetical protein
VKGSLAIEDLDEGTSTETWEGREMLIYLSSAITSCAATIIRILQRR